MKFLPRTIVAVLFGLLAGVASAEATLLNASYDVARDVYKDFNPLFQKHWKAEDGRGHRDQAVARRLDQAGARRRRRSGSRRGDDEPGQRHRVSRRQGPGRQGLGEEIPQQRLALHFGDGLHRAQGQPEGDQGLVGPDRSGHPGHSSAPEEHRQRPQHLPVGLGLGAQAAGRQRPEGAGVPRQAA
jgi:hypothetical protein